MLKIIYRIIAVTCMGLLWFAIGIFAALNIPGADIDGSLIEVSPHLAYSQFNSEDVRQRTDGKLTRTSAEDPPSSEIGSGPITATCIIFVFSAGVILLSIYKQSTSEIRDTRYEQRV